VYTDVIQCVVLIGGCLLVLVIGLIDLGGVGGLLEQIRALDAGKPGADHTRLILPVDTQTPFPWTGIFFGLGLILGPAYWIGNQAIVQRSLGARTEFEAKASYIWGALLKNILPVIIAVPGLIALAKFPELKNGDDALPTLVSKMLPVGFRGLFLAAFLAALMSSVDSYVNSAATILTYDFYKRLIRPKASDRELLGLGRFATIGLMVWGVGFAMVISRMEGTGIYAIFQTLMAFFQGPALAVLLTGFLWPRATATGAFTGFLAGVLCSVTLFTLNQEAVYSGLGWQPLFKISEPFLYFSVWAFLVALATVVTISLFTAPPDAEKIESLVYTRSKRIVS
ncbi:MAG: sodium transporter, partial [Verrucomicrobia bacterium]|nr:sodium transporter [Verrucomicrobiota bacterium]